MADYNNFEKKDTWSTRPFISYDGGTSEGDAPAEVLVTKGVGKIKDIEEDDVRATIQLKIEGLKYGVNGKINLNDPAYEFVKQAYDNGELVQFRQEIQRKPNVDRSTPIQDLRKDAESARDNTRKLFVGFGYPDADLILSKQHQTDPNDDNKYKKGAAHALAADASNAVENNDNNTGFNPDYGNSGDIESKPWIGLNYDGTVNPGSYAVSCMPKMYFALKKKFKDSEDANDELIRKTTEEIVKLADRMQVMVYGGKNGKLTNPNRFYNSHLVARSILLEIIESEDTDVSNVNISDDTSRSDWEKTITKEAYGIWKWAINNYADFISSLQA